MRDLINEREDNERLERDKRIYKMTEKLRQEYGIKEQLETSVS